MTVDDARLLAELETAAWPSALQASEATIRRRFALGHTMLGAWTGDVLAGSICFVATNSDPRPREDFPGNLTAFSSLPRSEPVISLYTYNFCVRPEHRGSQAAARLLDALEDFARAVGARWMVGDGRCPSYNGGETGTPDKVVADARFRRTIDEWNATGVMPPVEAIIRDPLLRFYHRMLDCRFFHLIADFLPEDAASGGFGVIFAKELRGEQAKAS